MVIESTLAHFITSFRAIFPNVEVQLVEEGGNNLPSRLERGHIALALMAVEDERFDSQLLYPTYDLAIFSKSHRLARRRKVDVADISDEPFLLLRRGFASRERFEVACSIAHFRPRVLLESGSPTLLSLWLQLDMELPLCPPRSRFRVIVLGPWHWCITVLRKGGGYGPLGIPAVSCRCTHSASSLNWSPTASGPILAANSSGTSRACRNRDNGRIEVLLVRFAQTLTIAVVTAMSASLIGHLGQALSDYPPLWCRCRSRARASSP